MEGVAWNQAPRSSSFMSPGPGLWEGWLSRGGGGISGPDCRAPSPFQLQFQGSGCTAQHPRSSAAPPAGSAAAPACGLVRNDSHGGVGVLQLELCSSEDSRPRRVGRSHWLCVSILGSSMLVHLGKSPFRRMCLPLAPGAGHWISPLLVFLWVFAFPSAGKSLQESTWPWGLFKLPTACRMYRGREH